MYRGNLLEDLVRQSHRSRQSRPLHRSAQQLLPDPSRPLDPQRLPAPYFLSLQLRLQHRLVR
jgi:hypothetical protein